MVVVFSCGSLQTKAHPSIYNQYKLFGFCFIHLSTVSNKTESKLMLLYISNIHVSYVNPYILACVVLYLDNSDFRRKTNSLY